MEKKQSIQQKYQNLVHFLLENKMDLPLTQLLGSANASIPFPFCSFHLCCSPLAHPNCFHVLLTMICFIIQINILQNRGRLSTLEQKQSLSFPSWQPLPWKQWSKQNIKSSVSKSFRGVLALCRCGRWNSQKPIISLMFFLSVFLLYSSPTGPFAHKDRNKPEPV